jgi:hypothetical protein
MARLSEHRSSPWVAFAAGAVVMLLIALLWSAWANREAPASAARLAAGAIERAPNLPRPKLPDAPRLPDAPTPMPK